MPVTLRYRLLALLSALAFSGAVGCGSDSDEGPSTSATPAQTATTTSTSEVTAPAEPTEPENSLAPAVGSVEKAGFENVHESQFNQSGVKALGSIEAKKNGADFVAAEFATPAEATKVSKAFAFLERDGYPLEVSQNQLFYAYVGDNSGSDVVIAQADFDAFVAAIEK